MERILPGFAILALLGLMLMLSHLVFEKKPITERIFRVGVIITYFSMLGFVLTLMAAVVLDSPAGV